MVEKSSRKGKLFYGCDNFPKCRYAVWDQPVAEACPECQHPFLVQKNAKGGATIRCPKKDCSYSRPMH
jgi:DNA topoisomerase-1